MKFNERLIELRKQKGLSQEELGYKLNVTRQTVSKWELGQTTPEMDKLVEMSKFFNISIDELTKEVEEEVKESTQTTNNKQENKVGFNWKPLLIILGSLLALGLIAYVIIILSLRRLGRNVFKTFGETANVIVQQAPNVVKNITEITDSIYKEQQNILDNSERNSNEVTDEKKNEVNEEVIKTESEYNDKATDMQAEYNNKVNEMKSIVESKGTEEQQQLLDSAIQQQQQILQQKQ